MATTRPDGKLVASIPSFSTNREKGSMIAKMLLHKSLEEIIEKTQLSKEALEFYLHAYKTQEFNYPIYTLSSGQIIDCDLINNDYYNSKSQTFSLILITNDIIILSIEEWVHILKAHRSWFANGGYTIKD